MVGGVKAVIMAGGEGTRLRPLTSNQPKPMLPMANRPMMEHVIRLLRQHGFTDIVVTVAFMANAIRTYFGDGSELGVRMVYATEETPLGTAGSVLNARDELDERFLVISGDVLTDIDLSAMVAFHEEKGALATLALQLGGEPARVRHRHHRRGRRRSSASWRSRRGARSSATPSTPGSTCSSPRSSTSSRPTRSSTSPRDVFPAVLEAGRPIYGFVADGYWEDVGTTEAYLKAHRDILDEQCQVEIDGFQLRPGRLAGQGLDASTRAPR